MSFLRPHRSRNEDERPWPDDDGVVLGVARISVGSGLYRAALALAERIAKDAYSEGTLAAMIAAQVPFSGVQALFAP